MANSTAKVPLDNFVQNGDLTLNQLVTDLAALNGGTPPDVAEQIRDPATGKLVQVKLSFPDTVASAAVDAINANPGVPSVCGAIPQILIQSDLKPETKAKADWVMGGLKRGTIYARDPGTAGNNITLTGTFGATGAGNENRPSATTVVGDAVTYTYGTDSAGNSVRPLPRQIADEINFQQGKIFVDSSNTSIFGTTWASTPLAAGASGLAGLQFGRRVPDGAEINVYTTLSSSQANLGRVEIGKLMGTSDPSGTFDIYRDTSTTVGNIVVELKTSFTSASGWEFTDTDTLTMNFADGTSLQVGLNTTQAVPKTLNVSYWVDINGNLYKAIDSSTSTSKPYDEAACDDPA